MHPLNLVLYIAKPPRAPHSRRRLRDSSAAMGRDSKSCSCYLEYRRKTKLLPQAHALHEQRANACRNMNENAAIYCHAHALAPLLVRLGAPRVQHTVVESVRTDSTVVSCTRGARAAVAAATAPQQWARDSKSCFCYLRYRRKPSCFPLAEMSIA